MQRNQKVAVVGGLLAIGVIAALPFSRSPQTPPTGGATPGQAGFLAHDIPLQLPAQSGVSPATGLHDEDPGANPRPAVVAPSIERNRLEGQGLPPELPDAYHSLITSPLPEGSGARRLADPPQPADLSLAEPRVRDAPAPPPEVTPTAPRERQHRIVDGDTLTRLAERYWGDATLAEALYAANRDVLTAPDPLPLGVVMKIPAAPQRVRSQVNLEPSLELAAPVRQPVPRSEANLDSGENLPLAPIPAGALGNSQP